MKSVQFRRAQISFSFVQTPFQALVENRPEIPESPAVQCHLTIRILTHLIAIRFLPISAASSTSQHAPNSMTPACQAALLPDQDQALPELQRSMIDKTAEPVPLKRPHATWHGQNQMRPAQAFS
jgi:hypothetical protein